MQRMSLLSSVPGCLLATFPRSDLCERQRGWLPVCRRTYISLLQFVFVLHTSSPSIMPVAAAAARRMLTECFSIRSLPSRARNRYKTFPRRLLNASLSFCDPQITRMAFSRTHTSVNCQDPTVPFNSVNPGPKSNSYSRSGVTVIPQNCYG